MGKTYSILAACIVIALVGMLLALPPKTTLDDLTMPKLIDTLPILDHIWHKASVSLGDYNNDGLVDIFVTTNARGYIYKNQGDSFKKISDEETRASFDRVHMGVWGDVDNDGCKDLFVTRQSQYRYGFYKNNCDGSFTRMDERIQPPISVNGYGASFVDLDNDGFLDVFAVSFDRDDHRNFSTYALGAVDYSDIGGVFDPIIYTEKNSILLQRSNLFVPLVSAESSVLDGDLFGSESCAEMNHISAEAGRKLGPKFGFKQGYQPVWFDANGDGILDVLVSYDFGFSALYEQTDPGVFVDATSAAHLCKLGNAMGVAVGDIDNDGDFDIYETNIGSNYLFVNDGKGVFEERGAESNVVDYSNSGWGTSFADFNNDTLLDIVVANGHEVEPLWPYDEMDKIFLNRGNNKFNEIAVDHVTLFSVDIDKRVLHNADAAAAVGDLNNDGFPDAVIFRPHTGILYALYGKPNGNHWLEVSLEGTTSNRDAIGAIVTVQSGGVREKRIVTAGASYLSQDDTRLLFGLGRHTKIDTLTISWPSGFVEKYHDIEVDQNVRFVEGSSQ